MFFCALVLLLVPTGQSFLTRWPGPNCRASPYRPATQLEGHTTLIGSGGNSIPEKGQEVTKDGPSEKGERAKLVAGSGSAAEKAAPTRSEGDANEISHARLVARTLDTLDWGNILEALSGEATTVLGKARAADLELAGSAEEANEVYELVREVSTVIGTFPGFGSSMDIEEELDSVARGSVLDVSQLLHVSSVLGDLQLLRTSILKHDKAVGSGRGEVDASARGLVAGWGGELPLACGIAAQIVMPEALVTGLAGAFDDKGELSELRFPALRSLRQKKAALTKSIESTLRDLLAGALKDAVADARIIEQDGRYLVPVKPTNKRGVGIVHGASNSGRTVYVEPAAVVEPTNELKEAQLALKREEQRILSELTRLVFKHRAAVAASLLAASSLDLACARAQLGRRLGGTIPEVGRQGVIALKSFRHPVLTLRYDPSPDAAAAAAARVARVVGNDLSLNATTPGLVLTGPNAGGKTVVLKTLGLAALLARAGVPLPVAPGSSPRVDFFGLVLADIGDMQSVGGDLSTFSGHLLVCKAILDQAVRVGGGGGATLVLMDEIGSGTDPAQGVALAQALLEAILAASPGSRVAITTHYLQLKELAATDPRFEVAGMEFVEGRPTYRLSYGLVGESHAISVAQRLELPSPVILRARELLDDGVRQVSDLILKLEEQTAAARLEREEMATLTAAANQALGEAERKAEEAEERYERAWAEAAADYAKEAAAMEARMAEILQELESAQAGAEDAGSLLAEARGIAGRALSDAEMPQELPVEALGPGDELEEGEAVVVVKPGVWLGSPAVVVRASRNQVELDVGGQTLRVKKNDVGRPASSSAAAASARGTGSGGTGGVGGPGSSGGAAERARARGQALVEAKAKQQAANKRAAKNAPFGGGGGGRRAGLSKRTAAYLSDGAGGDDASGGGDVGERRPKVPKGGGRTMRVSGNTVDCLGLRVDEATAKVERRLNEALLRGDTAIYILHGHGTGALKNGVRTWLKQKKGGVVKKWGPASDADGGDAFTALDL